MSPVQQEATQASAWVSMVVQSLGGLGPLGGAVDCMRLESSGIFWIRPSAAVIQASTMRWS